MSEPTFDPLNRRSAPMPFDDHPLLTIWELTQACDLACVHCRASAVERRDPRELTTAEGKRLLDSIAQMGTPLVVLTGGDPAKRPDLVELVEHGAKAGLIMAVTPSGTPLMTRELLRSMKDAGLARLAVSLDAPDAETHDAFRKVQGSFTESMRILNQARDLGIETQINTSLAPHNLHALGTMAELVGQIGAVLWSVFVVVETGRAESSLLLGPDELEEALHELAAIAESVKFDVKTTAAPHFRRILLERKAKRASIGVLSDVDADGVVRGHRGINDGAGFLFVSHRGDVYPSGFLPLKAGNIRVDDLATIYREHPLFRSLRNPTELGGKCGVCPFKLVCGGSRARAFAAYGDPLASDPGCAYVPKNYRPSS